MVVKIMDNNSVVELSTNLINYILNYIKSVNNNNVHAVILYFCNFYHVHLKKIKKLDILQIHIITMMIEASRNV